MIFKLTILLTHKSKESSRNLKTQPGLVILGPMLATALRKASSLISTSGPIAVHNLRASGRHPNAQALGNFMGHIGQRMGSGGSSTNIFSIPPRDIMNEPSQVYPKPSDSTKKPPRDIMNESSRIYPEPNDSAKLPSNFDQQNPKSEQHFRSFDTGHFRLTI